MQNLIDTHCHLTLCKNLTPKEHIDLARKNGITKILDPGLHFEDFEERYQILKDFPEVLFGLAIAPHYKKKSEEENTLPEKLESIEGLIIELEKIIQDFPISALSEIGLDYFYLRKSKEFQRQLFLEQLKLAKKYSLPVFLHIRDKDRDGAAYHDAFEVVKESGYHCGAIHCFSSVEEYAKKFLDWGFYLSFSGIVTFKNAQTLQKIVVNIPKDRILTETDAPFLAPVPMRGKPNQSAYLVHTHEFIAKIRGINVEEFNQQCFANSKSLINF